MRAGRFSADQEALMLRLAPYAALIAALAGGAWWRAEIRP